MNQRDRDFQRRLRTFDDVWRRVGRPGPIGPPTGGVFPPPPPPPPDRRPCRRRRRPPGWR